MRRFIIIIISLILIVFGISGIIFSFVFVPKLSPINMSSEAFSTLSISISEGFDSISQAMDDTSIAAVNISESVTNAKDSLETASKVTDDTSKAFREMSKLVDFDILGLKPFENVSIYFQDGSESLSQLSEDLSDTGQTLNMNSSDILQLGSSLTDISLKIEKLSVSFNQTASSISFDQFGKIFFYLKIYITALHGMFILIGFSMLFLNVKPN